MAKKADLQKDFTKLLNQTKERVKEFGKEVGVLAKKSEKEIIKASKVGKTQLDIIGLNMQKEKLYYDIGKKVASLNAKKKLDIEALEPYWKKLHKLAKDARSKKRELSFARKTKK